jgi:hypothetical protein
MRFCDAPMVKEVTTVVKITVIHMKSDQVGWSVAVCCAFLLAVRKITRSSSALSPRSRRFPTVGGDA